MLSKLFYFNCFKFNIPAVAYEMNPIYSRNVGCMFNGVILLDSLPGLVTSPWPTAATLTDFLFSVM